ncbi:MULTISPECIES: hypothetical protein [Eikenella]|nr:MULTISPECIES: hypothetical protein [Eikenella]
MAAQPKRLPEKYFSGSLLLGGSILPILHGKIPTHNFVKVF